MTRPADRPDAPGPPDPPPGPASPPAFAVGYVAIRPAAPSGATPEEVRHGVEVVAIDSEAAALRVGLAFALFKLPVADGWTGHQVVACPTNVALNPEADWR
jgi:hypothetical protein